MSGAATWHGGGPDGLRAVRVTARDGVGLRVALASADAPRALVAVLPGRSEWAEKYADILSWLVGLGHAVVIPDWRGQGLSDRLLPDPLVGHVRRFADYQSDLTVALATAREAFGDLPLCVLAHSMGGCIALRALMGGLDARAAAFSAPMWGLPLARSQRIAVRALARMGRRARYAPGTGPDYGLRSQVFDANDLTADRSRFMAFVAQATAHPDLMIAGPSLGWVDAALAEMSALSARPSPVVPALALLGSEEAIVAPRAVEDRMARWPGGELLHLPGAAHEILMVADPVRDTALARIASLFDHALGASS